MGVLTSPSVPILSPDLQTLLVFASVALTVRWLLRRPANLPPGPEGLPLIGCAHQLKGKSLHLALTDLARRYGNVFTIYLGTSLVVVLNDAVSIHEALIKQADCFSGRKTPQAVKQAFPNKASVLFDTGKSWKAIRRFATGAMRTFGMGKNSIALQINEEARILCDSFEKENGRPFDPLMLASSASSNVICQISFGERFEYDNEYFIRVQTNLRKRMTMSRTSLVNYIPLLYYTPLYRDLRELEQTRRKDMQLVVTDHLSNFDPGNIRDIIDLFLNEVRHQGGKHDAKFPFVEGDVERLLHDLFGGGTDTSANMIMWLILFMTQYPDVQRKVQDELDTVVGSGRQPAWTDRLDLPYCEATTMEALRIRPTGALALPHMAEESTTLLGYSIPKGTMVIVNIFATHFDPKYWHEPNSFKPERFLSADGKEVVKPTDGSYIPFSTGRRACVGELLARMEFFLFTVNLLQRFTFTIPEGEPSPDMDGVFGVSLAPRPFRVCATPRLS